MRAAFKITPKMSFKSFKSQADPTSWQLLLWLSSVYGPLMPVCTLITSGHAPDESADSVLGDLLPDLDQGISELLDSQWLYLAVVDAQYITYLRCSIGFRSVECEAQSMALILLSSRNCLHTLATWGWTLSYTRRNPGPVVPTQGLTIALRIVSPLTKNQLCLLNGQIV